MQSTLITILRLVLLFHFGTGRNLYVSPSASLDGCPTQPCLTLDQYIREHSEYFTTGSLFAFLPGNHSLTASLNLTDVSNIMFKCAVNDSHPVIMCNVALNIVNVTNMTITGLTFLVNLTQNLFTAALVFTNSDEIAITDSVFRNGNDHFVRRRAIFSSASNVIISGSHFEGNTAGSGGAIRAETSIITFRGNSMKNNSAISDGGAIYFYRCKVLMAGTVTFRGNFVRADGTGGAITVDGGMFTVTGVVNFTNNKADSGGALYLTSTRADFTAGDVTFRDNVAKYDGGGMYVKGYTTVKGRFTFVGNRAEGLGPAEVCGAICLHAATASGIGGQNVISAVVTNNSGTSGGALFIEKNSHRFTLSNITALNNSGGALGLLNAVVNVTGDSIFSENEGEGGVITIIDSTIRFYGNNTFENNFARYGAIAIYNSEQVSFNGHVQFYNNIAGGVYCVKSTLIFVRNTVTVFANNSRSYGAAIFLERGRLRFSGNTRFTSNTATEYGGGLYASSASVYMQGTVDFSLNSAKCGGAMFFTLGANLSLEWYTVLTTSANTASEYGGAIYHEDSITIIQCTNVSNILHTDQNLALSIQPSFLQIHGDEDVPDFACPQIISQENSAIKDGSFLYGGLLDRSRLLIQPSKLPYDFFTHQCLINITKHADKNEISSEPFQLGSCDGNDHSFSNNITVYRGQTIRLNITALGQGQSQVPTTVRALLNPGARLKLNQSAQSIPMGCSEVTYNLYSTEDSEQLTLFPEGPCQTIGQASTVLNVTFLPCPDAFKQSNEECVCEDRLQEYNPECLVEDGIVIERKAGQRFWMNASRDDNGTYQGLILYSTCPAEYCTAESVNISLNEPDVQCAFNRSGVLCGRCAANYSLILGGPRCDSCSNLYLLLIIAFALAGVALVAFLTLVRVNVAIGSINSVILYANIIQVNKTVFFPNQRTDLLTVFIAWMNLDLGFETCFFDGMDAYTQTWLQFVFSVYVWILISLIILISRHSITVSKFIGSNPIAVLATLVLMSYNKLLKVIIDVFSSVSLSYPDYKFETVWLKDGNLLFLQSKHLTLSIITLLVVIFIFLPYTFFLLLGHLLYRLPYRRYYHWLLFRIKPLLDSYYAPYKMKTRFWTGFLLLIRCALYSIFSFNSLGGVRHSLLAINIAFSALGSLTWLMKGIYQHRYIDAIEISVYLNLIILSTSAATLSESNKEIVTYILVTIVFITTLGIVVHQFHLNYFSKSAIWIKIKSALQACRRKKPDTPARLVQCAAQADDVADAYREPLLDTA